MLSVRNQCLFNPFRISSDNSSSAPPEPPSRPLVTGFDSRSVTLTWSRPRPNPKSPGEISDFIVTISSKMVHEDDSEEFRSSSVGPIHTNSSDTRLTITELSPYTVYAFVVQVKKLMNHYDIVC